MAQRGTHTLNPGHDAGAKVNRKAATSLKTNKLLYPSGLSSNQESKQEETLRPIAQIIASQPKSMTPALEEIALRMLAAALQVRRCDARVRQQQRHPDSISRSANWMSQSRSACHVHAITISAEIAFQVIGYFYKHFGTKICKVVIVTLDLTRFLATP